MPAHTSTAAQTAELASRLRVSVWRVARRLRHESDPGITPTLHAALASIEKHGPMTPGVLATHEHVRKPTMTRTIAALQERELISRMPDPLDGRVAWLQVTPEGKRLLQQARRRSDEYLALRLRELAPHERDLLDQASQLLDRLSASEERS
jgi:DNA-binding MarR family transcriptional regulator